jgi:hypothetical protein
MTDAIIIAVKFGASVIALGNAALSYRAVLSGARYDREDQAVDILFALVALVAVAAL